MAAAASASGDPRARRLPQSPEEWREEDESEEEEEVESGDEDEGDGDGSEVASLADLCDPDTGSDDDPTFDPDADGDLEVEAVLRSRMSRMSISASARKGRKGPAAPKMEKEDIDLLAMVDKLIEDNQLEKLKVYECKSYLRMHKLRLTGKKEVLLNRIREHIEVKNAGEVKYPVSSFVLNCKGDACKGDVVMFEQNIYRRKKGAPREVKRLCGQRTNAGRIIKESYGTAKQQHTFTIEILWSKGYKPWPPLHPLLIKGRNLYKDKTMRQPWTDEEERNRVLQEKHARGFVARKSRASRIQEKEIERKMKFNRIKENKTKEQQGINQKQYVKVVPQLTVDPITTVHQRTDERKYPSLQNGERGNIMQQHIPLKVTPTQHNEVLPQKVGARTFKQECNEGPSIQPGGLQKQMHPQGTQMQQMFKDSHQQPKYQNQAEVLQQEGAMGTYRKECTAVQAPSQHNGGSGNARHHQISSKLSTSQQTSKYPQQPPNHQYQNDVRSYREVDYQNNRYRAAEYSEPVYQPRGNSNQHTNAHQRGSNCRQNAPHDHSVHQPLRSRNQNFSSRDQYYGQGYYHQYNNGYRRMTHEQYHPQQNQHQNESNHWHATQYQYHTQQNQHQNYDDHRRTNHKQHYHEQNQPQQHPVQPSKRKPCNFYSKNGWCRYEENCWYSHDF
ncbi:hypothetical protein EJB05_22573 [Eragrostis curvula]|uniref:C3H1-type domain-containing protein n=1 Tax=Eragrostis curvula TaxID=38414 RepID=A0A5J9V6L0_9POAL|nr:hypothetical protein EJB05_22573 [Eragrostis curvula]